jgi:hypothetical protein
MVMPPVLALWNVNVADFDSLGNMSTDQVFVALSHEPSPLTYDQLMASDTITVTLPLKTLTEAKTPPARSMTARMTASIQTGKCHFLDKNLFIVPPLNSVLLAALLAR